MPTTSNWRKEFEELFIKKFGTRNADAANWAADWFASHVRESLLGELVKVNYPFPLEDEIFKITGEREYEVEVTGDFSAGTHKISQSEWILKSKIKEYVNT